MTTEELLQKCIGRDQSAWNEFTRRYYGFISRSVGYKLSKLGTSLSKNETRDIVQEIFLSIWEKDKLRGVKNTACLKSWLAIVSLNITSNYCRKNIFKTSKKLFSIDDEAFLSESHEIALEEILPSKKFNTLDMLEANELNSALEKELSKLEYRQQLALKFNIYDGKSQKDIAKIMNIPEGTVATFIRRGKNILRKNLKGFNL